MCVWFISSQTNKFPCHRELAIGRKIDESWPSVVFCCLGSTPRLPVPQKSNDENPSKQDRALFGAGTRNIVLSYKVDYHRTPRARQHTSLVASPQKKQRFRGFLSRLVSCGLELRRTHIVGLQLAVLCFVTGFIPNLVLPPCDTRCS